MIIIRSLKHAAIRALALQQDLQNYVPALVIVKVQISKCASAQEKQKVANKHLREAGEGI